MSDICIKEKSRAYEIKLGYHSDLTCENYDAEIHASHHHDGRITILPNKHLGAGFIFDHSDPDRVIAIARMILAFADMVKKDNTKFSTGIDISDKA
jgi:hypothetical protein